VQTILSVYRSKMYSTI